MFQGRRVADRAIRLSKVVERGAGFEIAIRRLHRHHPVDDGVQEVAGVDAGRDRVGRVELHAEMRAVVDRVEDGVEHCRSLGELGIGPDTRLVVVLDRQQDVQLDSQRKEGGDGIDDPLDALSRGDAGVCLTAHDPACGARAPESSGYAHELGLRVDFPGTLAGVRMREIGRSAHHRHLKAGFANRVSQPIDPRGTGVPEETRVKLETIDTEAASLIDPLVDRLGPLHHHLVEISLGES